MQSQPIALDLFSGKGGWTDGLMAAGFKVYGFDIKEYEGYKGIFVKRNILEMTPEEVRSYNPRFICCSSPCEEFSIHGMKMFHKNPKHPDLGIKLFEHSKMLCESSGVPYIMENVRAAQGFVGRSVNHCGPFHLWGNGVPAIIPPDCYRAKKEMRMVPGNKYARLPEGAKKEIRNNMQNETVKKYGGHKETTAASAVIPFSLSSYVGRIAMENYGIQSLAIPVK